MLNTRDYELLDDLIELAVEEDISSGDLATLSIKALSEEASGMIISKADGVISGIEVAQRVIAYLSREYRFEPYVKDGDRIRKDQKLIKIVAPYDSLLSAERLMLNFLQRMSGIATHTRLLVDKLKGTNAKLLDTRKTAPGNRVTDKQAVLHGGGTNHRMGLYDMAMLKDNHIKVAGGVFSAITRARRQLPISIKIEVETTNLEEVKQALQGGADIIMLDNMSPELMKEAVSLIGGKAKTEASGNITEDNIREVAETGVDYISVGALTHTVKALDMSMNIRI